MDDYRDYFTGVEYLLEMAMTPLLELHNAQLSIALDAATSIFRELWQACIIIVGTLFLQKKNHVEYRIVGSDIFPAILSCINRQNYTST